MGMRALLTVLLLVPTLALGAAEARAANQPPNCSYAPPIPTPGGPATQRLLRTTETERVAFTCTDADGDPLTLTATPPSNGALVDVVSDTGAGYVDYRATYDPAAGFVGIDTLTVSVADGQGATVPGTYRLDVRAADYNTAPTCQTAFAGGTGPRTGGTIDLQFTCADGEGDPITVSETASANTTVTGLEVVKNTFNDDVFVSLTVRGGLIGPASVSVRPADTQPGPVSKIDFDVRSPQANQLPDCFPPSAGEIEAGERLVLTLACFDADQDPLTHVVTVAAEHGQVSLDPARQRVTYVADAGYVGPDRFTYEVRDGRGGVRVQQQSVSVVVPGAKLNTVLDDAPIEPISDATPTFAFRAPGRAAATFECRLDRHPRPAAWVACASPLTLGPLADGTYWLQVRALDGGEVDATPASSVFAVDTTAPAPPAITSAPPATTTQRDATLAVSSRFDGERRECRLDAAVFAACPQTVSFSRLGDGEHTFAVRTVDPAGNTSPEAKHTWTVTAAPAPPPSPTVTATATATATARPTATATARPTAPTVPVVVDAVAPAVTATARRQRRGAVVKRGLVLGLGCDEACLARVTVRLAGRPLGSLTVPRTAFGEVAVKLTRKGAARLERSEARRVSVLVEAVDAAGNLAVRRLTVRLAAPL